MRKNLLIFFFLLLFLTGCCDANFSACPNPHQCETPPTLAEDVRALQKLGVQFIKTGETYTIVIPSDLIFHTESANFVNGAVIILEPLARFLRCYETTMMRVAAFTDSGGYEKRNCVMTEEQARRLVAYLTDAGLDARILYAVGYGSAFPVGDNSIPSHRAWNRRIEIKFRRVVLAPLI